MCRILVVDDDEEYTQSIKELIEADGYEVVICNNGRDALTMQALNPFDIIVTDIIMPEVDGLEVIIQVSKSHPSTKLIAISGGGLLHATDLLFMAKHLGASSVLSKPFNYKLLKTQLKNLNSH